MYDGSPGKDCPSLQGVTCYPKTQHYPHRRQAAGKHISLLPIRFLMQRFSDNSAFSKPQSCYTKVAERTQPILTSGLGDLSQSFAMGAPEERK